MLDYTILGRKKIVNNNGVSQIDLLTPVIDNLNIPAQDLLIVNEYYVARPDLISLAVYGTDKYADLLCKYNEISNPFEMNENDIIRIPDISEFRFMFSESSKGSEFVDSNKTQNSIIEKKNKFQKELNETRSPAQQVVGETNYVIDKSLGVIFY